MMAHVQNSLSHLCLQLRRMMADHLLPVAKVRLKVTLADAPACPRGPHFSLYRSLSQFRPAGAIEGEKGVVHCALDVVDHPLPLEVGHRIAQMICLHTNMSLTALLDELNRHLGPLADAARHKQGSLVLTCHIGDWNAAGQIDDCGAFEPDSNNGQKERSAHMPDESSLTDTHKIIHYPGSA